MPRYDYSCTACKHVVEVIHGINDAGPRFCPNCGAEGTMRKGFSHPGGPLQGLGLGEEGPVGDVDSGQDLVGEVHGGVDRQPSPPRRADRPRPRRPTPGAPSSDGGN